MITDEQLKALHDAARDAMDVEDGHDAWWQEHDLLDRLHFVAADAKYIATARPAVVLALVEELALLREAGK